MPGPSRGERGGGWRSRKYDGSWRLSLLQSSVLILACEPESEGERGDYTGEQCSSIRCTREDCSLIIV